jgi:hypothetical protein
VRGPRLLQLRGTALDGGDDSDLLGALGSLILEIGEEDEEPVGPRSVGQLARAIAAIHRYDGVRARFAGPRGGSGAGRPAYRDPRERISGRVDVRVLVLPPR